MPDEPASILDEQQNHAPRCSNCAEVVDRADTLCAACGGEGEIVPTTRPLPDAVTPGGETRPDDVSAVPAMPPLPAPLWSGWYLAAALGAAGGAAAVTLALGLGGAAGQGVPVEQASLVGDARTDVSSPPSPVPPKWTQANSARWVNRRPRSVAFELPAETTASAWLTRIRPVLVVRCLANTTEAFVFTQLPAVIEPQDDRRTVHIGFDDDAEVMERWPGSADHDALFAPDGVAFARRLARARIMRFGFTPHNGSLARVEFDVHGFAAHIGAVSRLCKWK